MIRFVVRELIDQPEDELTVLLVELEEIHGGIQRDGSATREFHDARRAISRGRREGLDPQTGVELAARRVRRVRARAVPVSLRDRDRQPPPPKIR